jgi:hypothetical protein
MRTAVYLRYAAVLSRRVTRDEASCSFSFHSSPAPSLRLRPPWVFSPSPLGEGRVPRRARRLAARAIISHMPAPTNERQALEREREQLPSQRARYQRELDATAPEDTARRRFMWQLRRAQKRMAEVEARLTGGEKLGHPQ